MIQTKEKKCKGNYKTNKFPGCDKVKPIYKFGLCRDCFMDWCFDTPDGTEYYQKQFIPAGKKKVEKENKKESIAEKKEFREKNKSIAALILEARVVFQKWVRMRDANNACISCGQVNTELWDAGHFKKAELYTGSIFDERNCHKQCRKCNVYLNGNEGEYRKRLTKKYGHEWILQLDEDADRLRQYKYTREELQGVKDMYNRKIKYRDF